MVVVKNDRNVNTALRQARRDRRWTQQKLADEVGTTPINISRWENGATQPTPYFRQRLSEVFGKSPAELHLFTSSSLARIQNIPIPQNIFFTGREPLLATLHKRLSTARAAALTQPQALYGLGGIGKTQTAAEYAYRFGDDYTHVFWVWAASRETLVDDFVTLAELLKLPEQNEPDQQKVVDAVKGWLASQDGWLLIMDNADDLRQAREFLPIHHKGYVLYTTRARAAGSIAASMEVEQLSEQDGALLLLRWTRLLDMEASLDSARAEDLAAAKRIVREMDGLPLAIVQAGAYMEETGCGLEDYLHLYETYRKDLLSRRSLLISDYPETVATTWSLSFQQVEQASALAANVLCLCAFLAPDAIPEELLTRGAAELGSIDGGAAIDTFQFNDALKVLLNYSLVRRNHETHMLTIHRLAQAVLKDGMDDEARQVWAERTVRAINAAFPQADYGTGAKQLSYMPHVQECITLIKQYRLHFPEAAHLLYKSAEFLYFHGFYAESRDMHLQALELRRQARDEENLAVAESLNALAVLARLLGDFGQAESYHLHALTIREKALGPDDPQTALSLNNLGVLYRGQGRYEEAELYLQRALGIREQKLGAENPETLTTLLNLANLYEVQRRFEEAEQLLERVLAISERTLQPENPLIAHTLNLLARLCFAQEHYARAESFWNRSLTLLEKTLGSEHPTTAERLNDLARAAYAQGHFLQAQALCQKALNICEPRLGAEHPDTILYREHLNRIESRLREEEQPGDSQAAPSPH